MFSGAQISLYPMADDFVGIIVEALGALDPYRDRLRIDAAFLRQRVRHSDPLRHRINDVEVFGQRDVRQL